MMRAAAVRIGATAILAGSLCIGSTLPGVAASPASSIPDGRPALAPFAYLRFCQRTPGDCDPSPQAGRIDLTPDRMQELATVNRTVNGRIAPRAQLSDSEAWSLTGRHGNCNTFAVQKRHELRTRGWPLGALSLAVVSTPEGIGHLVLVVRGAAGDVVLDNMRQDIRTWNATGYRWHKIQGAGQPDNWVRVPLAARDERLRHSRARLADALLE